MNRSEPFKYFCKKLPLGSQLKFYGAVFFTFAFLTVGRDRTIRHVNAGHPPILHCRRDSGAIDELPGQKPALGLIEDFHRDASLETLVEEILARVRAHGRQEDDQALVIARVH